MWGRIRRLLPGHSKAEAKSELNVLPVVDRIQGASLDGDRMPPGTMVTVQYTDRQGTWHELEMKFLDAMYLLNLLKAAQLDLGFVMPDDPYATKPPKRP
jgi:hypothetical protein